MKTVINDAEGVVTTKNGSGLFFNDKEYHEAPFDNRWDDLYAFIDEGTGPAALTYEQYRDTGFFMRFFRHNQNDNIFMTYQMPHAWNNETDVYPHAHVIPMAAGSGTVIFDYAYCWSQVNSGTFAAGSGWTSGSVSSSYSTDDQYVQRIITLGAVPPLSTAHESDILVIKIERPGSTDDTDTYVTGKDHQTAAANLGILFFDLHYRKIKAGTITQAPEL